MNIGDKIRILREDRDMSQEEFGNLIGMDQGRISHYETGRRAPKIADLEIIAKGAGVLMTYFFTDEDDSQVGENIAPYSFDRRKMPIISFVQASDFTETIDNFHPNDADEWIDRPAHQSAQGDYVYGLRVSGDSMTSPSGQFPTFPEGTILHVNPEIQAECGNLVIARRKGHSEATFKQLKFDGDTPYLKALNPNFPPIFEKFEVIGKVVSATYPDSLF